jgi:predicted dehydrogenase
MPDPLLQDVAVHHLDLLRYLTGCEGQRILAHSFNPRGSRYPGNAALNFWLEMQDGVLVSYAGSMACKDHQTAWNGEWRLEGTRGVLLVDEQVRLMAGGQAQTFTDFSGVDSSSVLDEFLAALSEQREPETSGRDYLNTQKLVHLAQQSSQRQSWLDI